MLNSFGQRKCEQLINKAKTILSSELSLAHFNSSKPIVVAANVSIQDIGTTISHVYPDGKEKVVEHASKALNSAEKGYSQIKKKGLT